MRPAWREQELAEEREDRARLGERFRSGEFVGAAREALALGLADEIALQIYAMWSTGDLQGEALQDALQPAWVYNKSPVGAIDQRAWVRLFKACGPFTKSSEVKGVDPAFEHLTEIPTEPFTIWRGSWLGSEGRGMSWSSHRPVAADFADLAALRGVAGLWEAKIRPAAVLALFNDEYQTEVVVNPDYLRRKRVLIEKVPAKR